METSTNMATANPISPLRMFTSLLVVLFMAEAIIMFTLPLLFSADVDPVENLADSVVLVILSAPFIWSLIVRPLRNAVTAEATWANALLEHVIDGVVIFDDRGVIISCNPATEAMFGHTTREVIGQRLDSLLHASSDSGGHGLHLLGMSDSPYDICRISHDVLGRRKDGSVFHMDLSVSKVNLAGKVSFIGIIRDITERKRIERELTETQAKFLQQEKMASIGQLAAGVAHEINNPIGFISSNLGTLGKYATRFTGFIKAQADVLSGMKSAEELAEERKRLKIDHILADVEGLIRESLDGADRVRKIVADLKSFSRVDEAECKYADLNECLASTINIVWNELKYKAELVRDFGEIPQVKCYPQQLNQVFMNLLVNAAHAIDRHGEITVRSWGTPGSVCVSVSDTGCGIPKEQINRIFEPFFTTKEVGKGTGLGLSISYDIVKKHNGEISVQSEVGKGTTFTVTIPAVLGG